MRPKHIVQLDEMVNGVIEKMNERDMYAESGSPSLDIYLREYRTLGYNLPRQKGMFVYHREEFLKHDDAIYIVRDRRFTESIQKGFTRDGQYIPIIQVDPIPKREIGLSEFHMERVFEMDYISAMICDLDPFNRERIKEQFDRWNIRRVYIEDAAIVFKHLRKGKFYKFLAECVLDKDGLIITAG